MSPAAVSGGMLRLSRALLPPDFFKPTFHKLSVVVVVVVVITGPCPPVRVEEVDRTLQRQDSGVESALLYAKAWSKYTKELLSWVEKRLSMGELLHRWRGKHVETAIK